MQGSVSLLDLPEEVICALLRYLDATSLYFLGRTCTQLDEIIKDDITLWRRIDARRAPNKSEKISYCLDRCYDDGNTWTHTLLLRGDSKDELLIFPGFFPTLNTFSKLTILACENQTIDGSKYNVMAFPPQLHELSLKKTAVTNSLEFFKVSGNHFKCLRVLILDECDWLTSMAFMPVSKYKSLEILSVYKCRSLENSIAYLSLSSQGFKALKILDARLSPLGNTLVRAIYRMQSLLAIYLQNEDISYKLDYFRRKLEIIKGSQTRDFFVKDDEFDLEEPNEDNSFPHGDHGTLDDHGLVDYLSIQSEGKDTKMPQSVLYLDPYNQCNCGFEETHKNHILKSTFDNDDDDDDDDDNSYRHLLTRKVSKLADLIRRNVRDCIRISHPRTAPITFNHDTRNGHMISMNLGNRNEAPPAPENENNRSVVKLYIYPQNEDASDEPPTKRIRSEDDAGPSGLNSNQSGSDSEEDTPPSVHRPPTPHPDVAVDNSPNERSASYRIYFRDWPNVQIENIKDIHKDVKVPLRRLSLRGYKKVTNVALGYINDLDLDLLDVTYTSVTFEGVQKYLISHPLCRVVHERFCTCLPNLHF